jgi:hypothetical protein
MNAMPSVAYLQSMAIGYLITISIETVILVLLLSRRHSMRVRLFSGIWLSACTIPVVWLVLPSLFEPTDRWRFLLVAEALAPISECTIFWFGFISSREKSRWATVRDFVAIATANLCSFGFGEMLFTTV